MSLLCRNSRLLRLGIQQFRSFGVVFLIDDIIAVKHRSCFPAPNLHDRFFVNTQTAQIPTPSSSEIVYQEADIMQGPFLTSGDSIGLGVLPCRDAKPFGPSVHAPTNESSQSFPIFSYLSEDFRNWLRSAASCENGSFVYQHGSAAHWESAD